jgi:hypothetical protein
LNYSSSCPKEEVKCRFCYDRPNTYVHLYEWDIAMVAVGELCERKHGLGISFIL